MIVFVDPMQRGLTHVPVNAGIIETALAADPGQQLIVVAERAHLANLGELVDTAIWRKARQIAIVPPAPRTRFLARLWADLRNLRPAFKVDARNSSLVLGCLAPSTLYALRFHTLRHPQVFNHLIGVLHSNAAEITSWRARNPLIRATQLRSALALAPRRMRLVVLEDSIRRTLVEEVPEFADQFVTLPHPLPSVEAYRRATVGTVAERPPDGEGVRKPLRVAFLGAASADKGFDCFVDLARKLTRRLPGKIEFHAIGWLPPDQSAMDLAVLARRPAKDKIDRAEFFNALGSVDYVCMPYSRELYRYTASGTLLDAIAAGKPVIALRSPTLEDLQATFGEFGELANDLVQLENVIEHLALQRDPERYRRETQVMTIIRHARTPGNLVSQWRTFCPPSDLNHHRDRPAFADSLD